MPRHRRHHRSRSRRRRLPSLHLKHKNRNYVAAVLSMLAIVTLCTALAEPGWFYLHGGTCRKGYESSNYVHTLGVYMFFNTGHFEPEAIPGKGGTVYHYGQAADDKLYNCVTPKIVLVIQLIIGLVFFAIGFSLFAFILDLLGPRNRGLKIIRQNGLWNILTVLICVTVNGFCFWVTTLIEELQTDNKLHSGSKVESRFDVSFYLVAAAGGISIVAAGCNLLKRHPLHEPDEQTESLMDDFDRLDINLPLPSEEIGPSTPPPAYTP